MNRRTKLGIDPQHLADSPTLRALASEPRNVAVAFPGITGFVDCPFSVVGGTTNKDALAEAATLLASVSTTLEAISETCGKYADSIGGCIFMVNASVAMLESVARSQEGTE